MSHETPSRYVLRKPEEPSSSSTPTQPLPVITAPVPIPTAPTIPSSVELNSEGLYIVIKQAIVDGFSELKPLFRELITEAIQASQEIDESEEEPEITYRSRYDRMKLIVRLTSILLVVAALSTLFILLSGQIVSVTVLVIVVWAISGGSYVFVRRRSDQFDGKRAVAAARALKTAWIVAVIIAFVLLIAVLGFLKVNIALGLIYGGLSLILMYFTAREIYKWSELWIYREGTQLVADRPVSNFFFLKPFHKVLLLQKVNQAELATTWLDTKLGYDRVMLNVEGELDKYWNTLTFIVDGPQLIRSVNQGAQQAR